MSQSSKRAALSNSILSLATDNLGPEATPPESAAGRGIVGKALELHKEGLLDKVARLEGARVEEERSGVRLVRIDPSDVTDILPADRDARAFADASFVRLRDSIREQGQDTAIVVRPSPKGEGGYELAAGRRRLAACRELRIEVLARVLQLSDDEMLALQYRENAEREDVSVYERGMWLARVGQERGFSTTRLGELFKLSQPSIVEYLKIARLPEPLLDKLEDPRELTIADSRRLHAVLARAPGGLERMCTALEMAGTSVPTKVQVSLALRAAAGDPGPPASGTTTKVGRIVVDERGRKVATLTRGGNQWILRWAPEVDEEAVSFVADRIPSLLREWRSTR